MPIRSFLRLPRKGSVQVFCPAISRVPRMRLQRFHVRTTLLIGCTSLILSGCGSSFQMDPFKSNRSPEITSLKVNGDDLIPVDTAKDPPSALPHREVGIGGKASIVITVKDPDNDPMTYKWDGATDMNPDDGGSGSAFANITTAGRNSVTVTVTDGRGGVVVRTFALVGVDITGNRAPTVTLEVDPATVKPGGTVALRATGADADNDPALTYEFIATSGSVTVPDATKPDRATFTAPATEGTATVICIVTDSKKATGVANAKITIKNP